MFRNRKLFLLLLIVLGGLLAYYQFTYSSLLRIENGKSEELKKAESLGYQTVENYPRQMNTANWKVYRNVLNKYEIKYPNEWKISEESFEPIGKQITDTSLTVDIFPDSEYKDFLMKLTIEAFPELLTEGGISTDQRWEEFVKGYRSWSLKNMETGTVSINDREFLFTAGESTESGIPEDYFSKSFITRINDNKGTLAIIVRDRSVPRSEIFDQIVSTFKFLD